MSQKLTLSTSSVPTNPPLPPALISSLSQALLHSNAVPTIHATLLHECQSSGFLDAVRARVREILRDENTPTNATGNATSRGSGRGFGELMNRVMSEIVVQSEDEASANTNGVNGMNGHGDGDGRIVLPRRVMSEGIKVVREALDGAVDVVGED